MDGLGRAIGDGIGGIGDGISGLVGGAMDAIGSAISGTIGALGTALPEGALPVIGIAAGLLLLWLVFKR